MLHVLVEVVGIPQGAGQRGEAAAVIVATERGFEQLRNAGTRQCRGGVGLAGVKITLVDVADDVEAALLIDMTQMREGHLARMSIRDVMIPVLNPDLE